MLSRDVVPSSTRPPRRKRVGLRGLAAAVAVVAANFGARVAPAGIVRHDRDPQAYLNLAARPEYASVGRVDVTTNQPGAVGSGTLVATNWVLTAAHVLEDATSIQFTMNGQSYSAARWVAHPKYNGDLRRGFDLGLIQLAAPVTGVTPAGLYKGRNELGEVGTFVGFGKTGTGLTGDVIDDRLKRAGTNVIDGTVRTGRGGQPDFRNKLPRDAKTFVVDFDNPIRPFDSVLGASEPTDMEYLIARGDSGGAVFLDEGAGPLLAGIHSFAEIPDGKDDSDYGDVTGHTRVSKFADWIVGVTTDSRRYRRLEYAGPAQGHPMLLEPSDEAGGPTPHPAPLPPAAWAGASLLLGMGLFRMARRGRTS